jgi:ADP-ribosyl-[dinitrogen reductase] hydrolase
MGILASNNQDILEKLFERCKIRLKRGDFLDCSPDPLPENFDFDRIVGMMLGLAIGDSLGRTTEGMLPSKRRSLYGEIRDYLPTHHTKEKEIGLPSDDTQLAF